MNEKIRIYNLEKTTGDSSDIRKIKNELLIELSDSDIYENHIWDEDNPHIKIYLNNNFEFFRLFHIDSECRALHDAFGSEESWYIEIDNQGYPLDLRSFKGREYHHNNCISIHSYYENGTILKFKVYPEY